MQNIMTLLLIGLAGGVGAVTRYGTNVAMKTYLGESFPWGTLAVNVVGCFGLGLLMGLPPRIIGMNGQIILGAGFMGGLTTFSALAYESFSYGEHGRWSVSIGSVGLNLFAGFLAVAAGLMLARSFFPAAPVLE
jgi:fluoride exporter